MSVLHHEWPTYTGEHLEALCGKSGLWVLCNHRTVVSMSHTCPLSTAVGSCTAGLDSWAGWPASGTILLQLLAKVTPTDSDENSRPQLTLLEEVQGALPSLNPHFQCWILCMVAVSFELFSPTYCVVSLVASQSQLTAWFLRYLRLYEVYMIFVRVKYIRLIFVLQMRLELL